MSIFVETPPFFDIAYWAATGNNQMDPLLGEHNLLALGGFI